MRKLRKKKSKKDLKVDSSVRIARRSINTGHGECQNSGELRKIARSLGLVDKLVLGFRRRGDKCIKNKGGRVRLF